MAKDILDMFGPNSPDKQMPRARSGGVMESKDLPYSPPKGPMRQMEEGPGLHQDNCGNCGTQGKH